MTAELRGHVFPRRRAVWPFFVAELACAGAFIGAQSLGAKLAAALVLALPFQLAAWCVLLRNEFWLLLGSTMLFPLTSLELLPFNYWRFVYYPATLLLLAAIRATRRPGLESHSGRLPMSAAVALVLLGVWTPTVTLRAFGRGFATDPGQLVYYTALMLEVLAFVYFFATGPQSLEQVRIITAVVSAGYVATCFVLPFLGAAPSESLGGKTLLAPFGGYVNLNAFAVHACVALLLLLGLFLDARTSGRVVAGAGALVLLAALVLTRSRGAWLGFGLGVLYLLLRTRSPALLFVTVLGLALLLTSDVFRSSVFSRLGVTSTRDVSFTGRLVLWVWALRVLRDNWLFGVGIENYRYVKHIYGFPAKVALAKQYNAHNLFLELLVDLGVVGLLSFLWLKVSIFLRLHRRTAEGKSAYRGMAAGLNAAIIAYAAHGLWDCLTWQHGAFVLLGILLGLALSVSRLWVVADSLQGSPVAGQITV